MKLFKKKEKTAVAEKTYRTKGDIQAEYGKICAQIGDKEVKISFLQADINGLKARCKELDTEISTLPKVEEKADGTPNPAQ